MFQRTWHGIDLTQFPAAAEARDKPAPPEFFAQFYAALEARNQPLDPGFVSSKRRLGEVVGSDLIRSWKERHGREPRILALAVGKGIVEGVWAEQGYAVTFNDCQESSLKELREKFPQARFLVGDARSLKPPHRFDLIEMIGLDYCMNGDELAGFMTILNHWLEPDGEIHLCCMNRLTLRQVLAESVKRYSGHYRRVNHVFWGYWRSLSVFYRAARIAGLKVTRVFRFGQADGRTTLIPAAGLRGRIPPWRDPNVLLVYQKNG